ncbi:MAG: ATP-binding protein [Acetobacteraceae bacterium]|nr:ATP-binding protein [Acetobacteraceae bacterium]
MGVLSYVGLDGMDRVMQQTRQIVDRNLESTVRISEIAGRMRALDGAFYRLATLRAANAEGIDVTVEINKISKDSGDLIHDLEVYRDTYAQPAQVPAINDAIQRLHEYQQALEFVGSMLELDFASAVSFIRPFNSLFDTMSLLLREMTDGTVQDARRLTNEAATATQDTTHRFVGMAALTVGGVSAFAWAVGKRQQKILFNSRILEQEVADRTADLRRTADALNEAKEAAENALEEVKRTQKQLVEAEKMAALGSLVAGVAHEINTPIGTSLTAATVLGQRSQEFRDLLAGGQIKKADLTRYVDLATETSNLMHANIMRAAELIQSFKQVAVDQTSAERRMFNLFGYLEEVLISLKPRLRQAATEVSVSGDADIEMNSYPGAFSQVITNLVINALTHAFEEGKPGHIAVAVSRSGSGHARVVFNDDGRGIPVENLSRIFDPFFTTRRGQGGTGLGLHIIYNVITQQLGGTIAVESELGVGTTFTIDLATASPAESVAIEG